MRGRGVSVKLRRPPDNYDYKGAFLGPTLYWIDRPSLVGLGAGGAGAVRAAALLTVCDADAGRPRRLAQAQGRHALLLHQVQGGIERRGHGLRRAGCRDGWASRWRERPSGSATAFAAPARRPWPGPRAACLGPPANHPRAKAATARPTPVCAGPCPKCSAPVLA